MNVFLCFILICVILGLIFSPY